MIKDIIDLLISFLIASIRLFMVYILLNYINIQLFDNKISDIFNILKNKNKNKIYFSDVIGLENIKSDLKEYAKFIKNRKKYTEVGFNIPRGIIFSGPPGTGKTLLAKALANETNYNFIHASGSDFIEIFVGVGAKRIRELFQKAKRKKPSIIFIDEIDTIGRNRNGPNSSGYNEQGSTLNSLLVEMDGFDPNDEILVIAASNMISVLDPALMRSGRFDKKIYFDVPNIYERKAMFDLYLNKIKLHPNFSENLKENIETLSEQTTNCTGADIKNICNQAVGIYMKRYNAELSDGTTMDDICMAIDDILIGIEKRERIMSLEERNIVAHHEAGHALIAYILKECSEPVKVSIIPRGEAALGFSMQKQVDKKLYSKNDLLAKICVLLGGRTAELLLFNNITTGSSDDIMKATQIAESMIKNYGMNSNYDPIYFERKLENNIQEEINKEINLILDKCRNITTNILTKNKENIKKLGSFLLKNEILNSKDFEDIFNDIEIEDTISVWRYLD
jgi:ATP-dependent metalloprotease FtsH